MFIWLPERLTSVWWFMPGRQGRKEILPELRPFPFLNKPAICYPGLLSGHTWTFCSVQRTSWRRGGGSGSCSPGCAGCGWSRCWWRCSGGRSPGWRSPSPAWLSYGTGPGVKCQYFPLTETVYCDCDPSKTNIGRFLLVLASVWLVTGERRLMAATQWDSQTDFTEITLKYHWICLNPNSWQRMAMFNPGPDWAGPTQINTSVLKH